MPKQIRDLSCSKLDQTIRFSLAFFTIIFVRFQIPKYFFWPGHVKNDVFLRDLYRYRAYHA